MRVFHLPSIESLWESLPKVPTKVDPNSGRPAEAPPTPGEIGREAAVILIVCLSVALAAQLFVRSIGAG
jgi:hypothetical protein